MGQTIFMFFFIWISFLLISGFFLYAIFDIFFNYYNVSNIGEFLQKTSIVLMISAGAFTVIGLFFGAVAISMELLGKIS